MVISASPSAPPVSAASQPSLTPAYLIGYPKPLVDSVQRLVAEGSFGAALLERYPAAHDIRTDRMLYDYVADLRGRYLRNTEPLSKVMFDNKLHVVRNALGTHTSISRVQGAKLKAKREIRIGAVFKSAPPEFLLMIVVHELAHMKERDHGKAFYQLCRHMAPEYHQYEFDLRAYLTYRDAGGEPLWGVD